MTFRLKTFKGLWDMFANKNNYNIAIPYKQSFAVLLRHTSYCFAAVFVLLERLCSSATHTRHFKHEMYCKCAKTEQAEFEQLTDVPSTATAAHMMQPSSAALKPHDQRENSY